MPTTMTKLNAAVTLLLCFSSIATASTDAGQQERETITPDEPMNGSLVSPSRWFRLGFFTPGSSKNRYLGMWYNNISVQTVVWVANRRNPIPPGSSSIATEAALLRLDANGTLLLTNHNGTAIYWQSSNSRAAASSSSSIKPVARLLDTGNLQVVDAAAGGRILWESFDYPTDTLLPGMKMGVDLRTGLDRRTFSWKSPDDPAPGDVSMGVDAHGVPQIFLDVRGTPQIFLTDINGAGTLLQWRGGPWNGMQFTGVPEMQPYDRFNYSFVVDPGREVYFQYAMTNASITTRFVVRSNPGMVEQMMWIPQTGMWVALWFSPKDRCDAATRCGPYEACGVNDNPPCSCLPGFRHHGSNWGCERETPKDCTNGTDGFLLMRGAKLPDTSNATLVGKGSMGLDQCRAECLRNCSCTAYAAADITTSPSQSGCIIWTSELRDIRVYANGRQDLYVRLAAKDVGSPSSTKRQHRKIVWRIAIPVFILAAVALLGGVGCARYILKKDGKRDNPPATTGKRGQKNYYNNKNAECEGVLDDLDLPLFEFSTIMVATDHFDEQNKLGRGGFGPVYKGRLENGQDVAIKRLASNSSQGTDEFKTEVILIAKLQHRNLVRLLGCCIQDEERMLIYEYMPNGSLDAVLFDKEKGASLDWSTRYQIIVGIARGLLYLHQDSRLRIIHRDLKASNILLDKDMTPKISDFGLARIFRGDEAEANTKRVVGTYGYMSPEYAMDGIFSIKSDVFSFGVLVLEIISGMKNRGVFHAQPEQNLLGHVWSLWTEGTSLELADKSMGDSISRVEIAKCTRIGLLCVQEHPEDRPTMSSIILMLGSDDAVLPQPKQPGFTTAWHPLERESSSAKQGLGSINQVTMTMFRGR